MPSDRPLIHLWGRQRLEPDEDVRQARGVEQVAELPGHLGDRRQDRGEGPHGRRRAGQLGQARDRPERGDVAEEPDDEERLDHSEDRAADAVRGTQDARPERAGHPAPDGRPDGLAQADRQEETGQDDQWAEGRVHVAEDLLEPGQGQDGEHAASDRPEQAADLGAARRTGIQDRGQDDQPDGDEIDGIQVHGRTDSGRPHPRVDASRVARLPGGDLRFLREQVAQLVRAGQDHPLGERIDVEVDRAAVRQQDTLLGQGRS